MSAKVRFFLAVVVLLLLMTAPFLLTVGIALHELQGEERTAFVAMIQRWLPIGAMLGLVVLLLAANGLWLFFRHYVLGLMQLAEKMRLMIEANRAYRLTPTGAPEIRAVAEAANALADARDALQADVESRIAAAKAATEEERNRLAALVADLPMPVLVCNLDGRILLYNNHARLQVRALVPDAHAGGGVIGLGRSIYGVFDRSLIGHALESLQHRLERAGGRPLAHFITTTRAGR